MELLNVQVSADLNNQLKALAKEKGVTKSKVVRELLMTGLNNDTETAYGSIIVDLDKRVKNVEDEVNKGWIRKILKR